MYKALDKWFMPWLRSSLLKAPLYRGTKHLVFCTADHFEPFRTTEGRRPASSEALADVRKWLDIYNAGLSGFRDADGYQPCHTFFYPAEEYDSACLDQLASFCSSSMGEVEIQLHHRNDTPAGFKEKLNSFAGRLSAHGLLGRDRAGVSRFGFVHGNWALCNSRPDGDWCGVNEEITLLGEAGCYADFTFPSAPSPTQPAMVNAIYRASERPGRPCSHSIGIPVSAGCPDAEGLLLITGPLALAWRGLRPRLENAALTGNNPPVLHRIQDWIGARITVSGREDWIFVKVHMHGLIELDSLLLSEGLPRLHDILTGRYNDGTEWVLHYASAREMYNIVRAAECGKSGSPAEWRDFEISRPECRK